MFDLRLPAALDLSTFDLHTIARVAAPLLLPVLARALPLVRGARQAAAPRPRARARAALHTLLRDLFSAEELLRFLRFGDDTAELVDDLPGAGAPLAALTEAAVLGLERRGLVTGHFFDRLAEARPGRLTEIAACRDLWSLRSA